MKHQSSLPRYTKHFSAVAMAVTLAACGGGNGTSSTSSTSVTRIATFIDAHVEGLEYSSPSYSGVTDEWGNFKYVEGESVSFNVGPVALGSVQPVGDVVRAAELVPTATTPEDPQVTLILQTLQTLDDNGNPDDGIRITPAAREKVASMVISPVALDKPLPPAQWQEVEQKVKEAMPTGDLTVTEVEARDHYERNKERESNSWRGYESPADVPKVVSQPQSLSGRLLASNCFQCHGTGGLGGFDRITGGEANEVFEFLSDSPSSSIMAAHAQGFTQAQLRAIANYLAQ